MLDGLLTMSYAKCVADHELIDILYFTIAGDDREDADEALATIAEVAPGGHFLDSPHTRSHFPYQPQLQDYNTYEQWDEEGRLNADERGRQRAREVLNAYEEPDLDPGISKALGQFVNRRTTELGA
jgi:trimethylamine--corrinoid protein Co-methyltransferase